MSAIHSNGNGRGIPAVAYVRMSSDRQDASPQQQRDEIAKLAARGGYHLVAEYADEAISGDRTDKRTAFQRMIADAGKGRFKAILCWDQDRFGRFDSVEAGYWIHPLRQASVKLVTVAQGEVDWTTFAGRLIYNVQQEGKHAYLRDLSRNVLRGRLAAARRGEWLTIPPLGYVVENKRLVINLTTVEIVRSMFRDYLGGHSLRAIAADLNRRGIRTRRGAAWSGKDITVILRNRAYCGEYRFGTVRSGKYHQVGEDMVVIPNNHPALIDRTTFDMVQRRLPTRRKATTPHANGGDFVFTGICQCGMCKGPMSGHRNQGFAIRLRCRNSNVKGTCKTNSVVQAELLDVVLTAIEERFSDPQTVERFRRILTAKSQQRTASVNVEGLRRQLTKVDQQMTTARRNMALADGDDLRREYEAVVRELRSERERLDAAIQDAQKPRQRDDDRKVDKLVGMMTRLRETVLAAPVPKQRELLATVIQKVEVWTSQSGGPRSQFHLDRGVVHLRPDMWGVEAEGDNLCSVTRTARRPVGHCRPARPA